ncbi:MAG: choice-of-anchor K domain-containing protein [Rhizonema sp. PD37]|nr:choice-of-anchor K domain-containing protein [Rhizonema sp. PD37]
MKLSSILTTTLYTFAVTTVTALGFSTQTQAITFSGNSSGRWGIPTSGGINTNPAYSGVGTNSFTWGEALPDDPKFGTPANKLTFTENSFSTNTNSSFEVGNLTYFNGTVPEGTNVDSVPLNLNLSLTNQNNLHQAFNFDFTLLNTPNDPANTPEQNADAVIIQNSVGDRRFTFDGNQYALELTGFSQDGGKTALSEFRVLEGATTTAGLYARITSVPPAKVPESGTIVGLSALGFYLISQRKARGDKRQETGNRRQEI